MLKNWKRLIIFIAALVAGLIFYTLYLYNMPHRDVKNEKNIVQIDAKDLFLAYEQNEPEADKKFLDKTIEITGKISEINIAQEDNPIIIFKNEEDFFGVSCNFVNGTTKQLKMLNTDDSVIVKGICKGYLSDVVLIDCIIIE